ncbi:hypothetical protein QBC37DRAFT_372483 [Rhypophila decipiens]|uniref:Uncharacterized protein n=1 Tax=Rhypophila decipiens TaxID=261697 RepID=A0AAN7BBH6_9PEZI|nr:hypothetical protein QBC37DRAFT_372483 [Rhypophila decipiens]
MLLSTITRIFTAIAIVSCNTVHAATVKYVDKDIYTKGLALGMLQRISTFRAAHEPLNDAQAAALNLLQHVVTTFDVNSVQDAEDACVAAFGRDECRYFSAQPVSAVTSRGSDSSDLTARAADCKCATLNNWCDSTRKCISHRTNGCNYASYGCGTVWIYPCDGRCATGTGGGGW